MKRINIHCGAWSAPLALVWNLALAYIIYMLCRLVYLAENWQALSEGFASLSLPTALRGCLMFDTSAILYTNVLYALLMLLPLAWKEHSGWRATAKGVFLVVNALAVVINIADAAYFPFTGRRTTASVFQEFSNEGNLGSIVGVELLRHWYLVIAGALLIALLYFLYAHPATEAPARGKRSWTYYGIQALCLLIFVPLCIGGMRGGLTHAVRPITLSNANQYVNRPAEAALVLNTPFALIRSAGKRTFKDPKFFAEAELDSLYSPLHEPQDSATLKRKNVVVIIVESLGREYIGALNDSVEGAISYTPFLDSLVQRSLTFDLTLANGRKSIDGMPSILSSIPRFLEPFFLTSAAMNKVSSLAGELNKEGYYSAFFHGAENGSMGFEAYARASGYQDYFGRTEYNQDKRFDGDKDFDGMWAIWDEEFLQFYALSMTEMKEPFTTAVFTASSHHPFQVPERYRTTFVDTPGDDNPLHKCIRYADHALARFFETARQQPWYANTLFVLTADHTNLSSNTHYQTALGLYGVPILLFDPSGELPAGRRPGIAQQIDIMPTVLGHLGYERPYVAFGTDLLHTPDSLGWAVTNNGFYQYVQGDYVLHLTDDYQPMALYNHRADWALEHDLLHSEPAQAAKMERQLKAIIQSYMQRMQDDRLVAE